METGERVKKLVLWCMGAALAALVLSLVFAWWCFRRPASCPPIQSPEDAGKLLFEALKENEPELGRCLLPSIREMQASSPEVQTITERPFEYPRIMIQKWERETELGFFKAMGIRSAMLSHWRDNLEAVRGELGRRGFAWERASLLNQGSTPWRHYLRVTDGHLTFQIHARCMSMYPDLIRLDSGIFIHPNWNENEEECIHSLWLWWCMEEPMDYSPQKCLTAFLRHRVHKEWIANFVIGVRRLYRDAIDIPDGRDKWVFEEVGPGGKHTVEFHFDEYGFVTAAYLDDQEVRGNTKGSEER